MPQKGLPIPALIARPTGKGAVEWRSRPPPSPVGLSTASSRQGPGTQPAPRGPCVFPASAGSGYPTPGRATHRTRSVARWARGKLLRPPPRVGDSILAIWGMHNRRWQLLAVLPRHRVANRRTPYPFALCQASSRQDTRVETGMAPISRNVTERDRDPGAGPRSQHSETRIRGALAGRRGRLPQLRSQSRVPQSRPVCGMRHVHWVARVRSALVVTA